MGKGGSIVGAINTSLNVGRGNFLRKFFTIVSRLYETLPRSSFVWVRRTCFFRMVQRQFHSVGQRRRVVSKNIVVSKVNRKIEKNWRWSKLYWTVNNQWKAQISAMKLWSVWQKVVNWLCGEKRQRCDDTGAAAMFLSRQPVVRKLWFVVAFPTVEWKHWISSQVT